MQGKDTLKNGKSTEIDGVRNEIIKQCLNNLFFVDTIVTLLNQTFETGDYPNMSKTNLVKPIHKKVVQVRNQIIGEFQCYLVRQNSQKFLKRLTTCFENSNLSHPHLMRFRPRVRTSNNCLILKTLTGKQFKENERLYSCFIDFFKAFDTVWRKRLLAKMNHMV